MSLKEIHHQRFIQSITEEYQYKKIWTIESLKEKINFLLPSNILMTENSLSKLIQKQNHFKVFRCLAYYQKGTKRSNKTYYIFRRNLPRE